MVWDSCYDSSLSYFLFYVENHDNSNIAMCKFTPLRLSFNARSSCYSLNLNVKAKSL